MTFTIHEAHQATLGDIKQHLSMAFVMESYGHLPDHVGDRGKLHYYSPFRAEEHPSFDIFLHQIASRPEPEERFGDFADPDLNQGDVLDLIAKFEGKANPMEVLGRARDLLVEQIESEWAGPRPEPQKSLQFDPAAAAELRERCRPLSASENWDLHLPRTHPGLSEVVPPHVLVHPDHDTLVYFVEDEGGELRGVRFRSSDGRKYAQKGSRNILMRLEPPQPEKPVFLVEGETDLWAAWGALHEDFEVLGVPGVGNLPSTVGGSLLAGRTVYLAFDPDEAGIAGRLVWAEYLTGLGCEVLAVLMPVGIDIAKLVPEVIAKLPTRARAAMPAPEGFLRVDDAYGRMVVDGRGENRTVRFEPVTNWALDVQSRLRLANGSSAFEGVVKPTGKAVTLPPSACNTSRKLRAWCESQDLSFYGGDRDAAQLLGWLQHETAFLPEVMTHDQVGLHEGTFVWHNGSIGRDTVRYAPITERLDITDREVSVDDVPVNTSAVFWELYKAQDPAVTGPILAWLAAAPLRTRFREFPILNISGVSGSGKSALTERFLATFSGSGIQSVLSSTTPWAVSLTMDVSSGFPVWFDEYRPGAREGAKQILDQLIRDAYTAQPSAKGGMDRSNLNAVKQIRTSAPIVVSGEDSFNETSHTERMILVRLVRKDQGWLPPVRKGFAAAYLRYLTETDPREVGDNVPPVFHDLRHVPIDVSHLDLSGRPAQNVKVLYHGWQLLGHFLWLQDPYFEMPELDLSRVLGASQEAGESSPIDEILQVLLENHTKKLAVWRQSGHLCVHADNLLAEAREFPSIVLPVSNAKGIRQLIQDTYDVGPPVKVRVGDRTLNALKIPEDRVHWLGEDEESHVTDNLPTL